MSSLAGRRWSVSLGLLLLLGCSRSATDATPTPSSAPTAPSLVTSSPPLMAPPATTDPAIPTPEDLEEDSAHRITEKNLESELDRLEREIQAE